MKRVFNRSKDVFEFAHGIFGIHVITMKFICPDCNLAAWAEVLRRGRS